MATKPKAPPTQVSYCTQCKPPVIIAIGLQAATGHTVNGKFHQKIKAIPLEAKDKQKVGENVSAFMGRIASSYKDKLK